MSVGTLVALQKAISYAAIALFLIAAYGDITKFRISNLLVFAIGALGVLHLILLGSPTAAIYALGIAALVFVVGFFMFTRGWVGAGDVKLLIATVLLIRYPDLFKFFVRMSVFGAALSLIVILLRNYVPLLVGARLGSHLATIRLAVPYGVAIAGAATMTILLQPLLFGYAVSLPSFL